MQYGFNSCAVDYSTLVMIVHKATFKWLHIRYAKRKTIKQFCFIRKQ